MTINIIYTVNTNNYDKIILSKQILNFLKKRSDFKFIIFTDFPAFFNDVDSIETVHIKPISLDRFKLIGNSFSKSITIPNGISLDRYIKINPVHVLPTHDFSIYHDARVSLNTNFFLLIESFKSFDWISVPHRYRKTFVDEARICFAYSKISYKQYSQLKSYSNEVGFTSDNKQKYPLSENGLIIRANNDRVLKVCEQWTYITCLFQCRDQLSLLLALYNLRHLNLSRIFLPESFNRNNYWKLHKRRTSLSKMRILLRKFTYFLRYIYICLNDIKR